jgi:hypothetical protein
MGNGGRGVSVSIPPQSADRVRNKAVLLTNLLFAVTGMLQNALWGLGHSVRFCRPMVQSNTSKQTTARERTRRGHSAGYQ